MVHNLCLDTIHTLKGQWDCLIGDFEPKATQRHQFLTLWKDTPFMSLKDGNPFWHFQPPRWLFPPLIT